MTLKSVLKIIIIKLKKKKRQCKVIKRNRWDFRHLRNNAKESASLIVCGRALQSLGAEIHVICFVRMISTGFPLGSLATDLQVQKLLIQLTLVRICWS